MNKATILIIVLTLGLTSCDSLLDAEGTKQIMDTQTLQQVQSVQTTQQTQHQQQTQQTQSSNKLIATNDNKDKDKLDTLRIKEPVVQSSDDLIYKIVVNNIKENSIELTIHIKECRGDCYTIYATDFMCLDNNNQIIKIDENSNILNTIIEGGYIKGSLTVTSKVSQLYFKGNKVSLEDTYNTVEKPVEPVDLSNINGNREEITSSTEDTKRKIKYTIRPLSLSEVNKADLNNYVSEDAYLKLDLTDKKIYKLDFNFTINNYENKEDKNEELYKQDINRDIQVFNEYGNTQGITILNCYPNGFNNGIAKDIKSESDIIIIVPEAEKPSYIRIIKALIEL